MSVKKLVAVLFGLVVFWGLGASEAHANGVLPVLIDTCSPYEIGNPNGQVKPVDSMGTYEIVDSSNTVVATADNVSIRTTQSKHCIGLVDVDATQAVIDGLLQDELFITVRSCSHHGKSNDDDGGNSSPTTCTFGEELVVYTDSEPIDNVFADVTAGLSAVVSALQAQLLQEILDRQNGDAALAAQIAANTTLITTNTGDIVANATSIATNAAGISANATGIGTNFTAIAANSTDIAANASGIAANVSGIAANASGISANSTDIAANAAGVQNNSAGVSSNAAAIATAQSDITNLQVNKQNRVTGLCPAGSSIRVINANGTVACEVDNDANTTYSAGAGLLLAGTTFSVDTAIVQARVTGACPAGSSIRAINSTGAVTCETDSVGADNLGNHSATTALDMNGQNVNEVNHLHLTNSTNRIRRSNLPSFGQAASFDPNTLKSNGLLIEHGDSESSGIYMDGDTMVMWSPGDNDVLRVYDEDGFSSGPIFTVRNNRTVRAEHRELVNGAVTSYDDDGSRDCPSNRVARGFDADDWGGLVDRIRLNCAYVR